MEFEIGGFALDEYAVDGDWESFNYCVAENYYDAMLGEEFDFLGYGSRSFIENIMYWLNYDGEIGKDREEEDGPEDTRGLVEAIIVSQNLLMLS